MYFFFSLVAKRNLRTFFVHFHYFKINFLSLFLSFSLCLSRFFFPKEMNAKKKSNFHSRRKGFTKGYHQILLHLYLFIHFMLLCCTCGLCNVLVEHKYHLSLGVQCVVNVNFNVGSKEYIIIGSLKYNANVYKRSLSSSSIVNYGLGYLLFCVRFHLFFFLFAIFQLPGQRGIFILIIIITKKHTWCTFAHTWPCRYNTKNNKRLKLAMGNYSAGWPKNLLTCTLQIVRTKKN